MILSHQHRFIFLKTRKTAGTSIELALSAVCGPDDIITPVVRRDELLRQGRGPQNYHVPARLRPWWSPIAVALGRSEREACLVYNNHMSAAKVKRLIDPHVWRDYRKVTVERNPWDREVSFYFWKWKKPEKRPSFEEFMLGRKYRHRHIDNFGIYSIRGKVVADVIIRFERLTEDFADFVRGLGIEDVPEIPNAKTQFRPEEARKYRAFYTPETRDAVARRYAREIELLGYEF